MGKQPLRITINLVVILLNALIWLILGFIIAINAHPGLPNLPGMKTALAAISFIIAGILLGLTYFLIQHNRTAYYLTLAFFTFTSILIVFDEVGPADIAFLFIGILPIFFLILDRKWYLQLKPDVKQ